MKVKRKLFASLKEVRKLQNKPLKDLTPEEKEILKTNQKAEDLAVLSSIAGGGAVLGATRGILKKAGSGFASQMERNATKFAERPSTIAGLATTAATVIPAHMIIHKKLEKKRLEKKKQDKKK